MCVITYVIKLTDIKLLNYGMAQLPLNAEWSFTFHFLTLRLNVTLLLLSPQFIRRYAE